MSYQGSPFSAVYGPDDYELDEENEEYLDDDRDLDDQDESDEGKSLFIELNYIYNYNIVFCLFYFQILRKRVKLIWENRRNILK